MAVTCELNNILLERGNGFKLEIADFEISRSAGSNKIPFMGVSGAGKSTLLNIMAAVEWPHQGTVRWQFPNADTSEISWSNQGPSGAQARLLRREFFGFAFQDSTLMEHLRIEENLSYPLLLKGVPPKKARDMAREDLEKVLIGDEKSQIADYLKRFPFELSGGQRQRVALVQAMVHDPYVLFADEPTGSLDYKTRQQVMQVLYDWVDEPGHENKRLLLWVTHHEDDPEGADVDRFLHITSGQRPAWKHVE